MYGHKDVWSRFITKGLKCILGKNWNTHDMWRHAAVVDNFFAMWIKSNNARIFSKNEWFKNFSLYGNVSLCVTTIIVSLVLHTTKVSYQNRLLCNIIVLIMKASDSLLCSSIGL